MGHTASLLLLVALTPLSRVHAAPVAPASLHRLAGEASDIVVGTVTLTGAAGSLWAVNVSVRRTLKGNLTRGTQVPVEARVVDNAPAPPGHSLFGLVFLAREGSVWRVLPATVGALITLDQLLSPAAEQGPPADLIAVSRGSVADQVVAELGGGLLDNPGLSPTKLWLLPGALEEMRGPALDAVALRLAQHPSPRHRALGLILQLQQSRLDALQAFVEDKSLPASEAATVVQAIGFYFRSTDPLAIALLGGLSRRTDRAAAYGAIYALRSLHTRETVPYLAAALDHSDQQVRYQAVAGLAEFANGVVAFRSPQSQGQIGTPSPYSNQQTREHFPTMPVFEADEDRHVGFWKAWWQEHQGALAF